MNSYTLYWFFYFFVLFIFGYLCFNWRELEKNIKSTLYLSALISCLYLMCGPWYSLLHTSHDIDLANEYREYQTQTISPIENRYNNIQLPDGYYYMGCEIVEVNSIMEEDEIKYEYRFGVVDSKEYSNTFYAYSSSELLRDDIPYLLTIDSMKTTDNMADDQIVVVWACVD